MKFKGEKIKPGNFAAVVIPRQDGDIAFVIKSINDYNEFEQSVPEPKPPVKMLAGGKTVRNFEDPEYLLQCSVRDNMRTSWMILKGLEDCADIEFETAKLSDPSTWQNVQVELAENFNPIEINLIMNGLMDANCLNMAKVDEAKKSFLATLAAVPSTSEG